MNRPDFNAQKSIAKPKKIGALPDRLVDSPDLSLQSGASNALPGMPKRTVAKTVFVKHFLIRHCRWLGIADWIRVHPKQLMDATSSVF